MAQSLWPSPPTITEHPEENLITCLYSFQDNRQSPHPVLSQWKVNSFHLYIVGGIIVVIWRRQNPICFGSFIRSSLDPGRYFRLYPEMHKAKADLKYRSFRSKRRTRSELLTSHPACSLSGGPCRRTWCPWRRPWRRCRHRRAQIGSAHSAPVHICKKETGLA